MQVIHALFGTGDFMAHGYCYLWNPGLVWLHFSSDLLIGLAYFAISLTLIFLVRRAGHQIPFHWMLLAFGGFIVACGATHLMEVWTLWRPYYWLSGGIKAITAVASVATAAALPPLIPRSLRMVQQARLSAERELELELAIAALEREVGDRKRAEEEVRRLNSELEERVRRRTSELARANEALADKAAIVEHTNDAIVGFNLDLTVTSWNPAAQSIFGYSAAEIVGCSYLEIVPEDCMDEVRQAVGRLLAGTPVQPFETVRRRKDGRLVDVHTSISAVRDLEGGIRGVCVISRDVTERRRIEQQLRQTQRLESLGLVAGGVAHDFNNLLVGIMGNASMLLDSTPASSPDRLLLERIVTASEKASHLTRQLLAFAGKGRFVAEKLDLSAVVREIMGLVEASVPKNVELRLELASSLPPVEADPAQVEQLAMNLIINGAEAIPEDQPGSVVVTTHVQDVDEVYIRHNYGGDMIPPGRYVSLVVHDTGRGMDLETQSRIFDPFFTTKFTGRGLGLAAVLGAVRGHKGTIRVYSEPGSGTTFKVLLPAAEAAANPPPLHAEAAAELVGSGNILVVDDEEIVRATAQAALARYGYTAWLAPDGPTALELLAAQPAEIALVLLDMTMPLMSGRETLDRLRHIRRDIKVVVSSGYHESEAMRRFGAPGISGFVQKPYTAAALAAAIRNALRES